MVVVAGALAPPHKVALPPGHSLMDWIRLGNSGKDLTGTGGQVLKVTQRELSKHKKETDIWMALGGEENKTYVGILLIIFLIDHI